jgi:catechol 2,3-dioxygenase-like lactoylglutathione lyase family enzyme
LSSQTAAVGTPVRFVVPVADLDAAIALRTERLGFTVRFRDGDRWAVLDAGRLSLALAAGEERAALTGPALMVRVGDVPAAVRTMVGTGARVVRPPAAGAHETRAVIELPDSTSLVLYSPTSS